MVWLSFESFELIDWNETQLGYNSNSTSIVNIVNQALINGL